jgi:hypothetical protein
MKRSVQSMNGAANTSLKARLRLLWWALCYCARYLGPRAARVLGGFALVLAFLLGAFQLFEQCSSWIGDWPPFESGPLVKALAAVSVYTAISCTLTILAVLLGWVQMTRKAIALVCLLFLGFQLTVESYEVVGHLSVIMPVIFVMTMGQFVRRIRPWKVDALNGKPLGHDSKKWGFGQ